MSMTFFFTIFTTRDREQRICALGKNYVLWVLTYWVDYNQNEWKTVLTTC